jgi:PAS domain S-box-containing protein
LETIDQTVALFDAESGQLLWGSKTFFSDILGAEAESLRVKSSADPFRSGASKPNFQPFNLYIDELCQDRPKLIELMNQVRTLTKLQAFTDKPMSFPASLQRWQGEIRASTFEWEERLALALLFHGNAATVNKADEARRREVLRRLSGSPALTNGDYVKAGKLIAKVAADSLNASRASIWNIRDREVFCVTLYDHKNKCHDTAPSFTLDDYPTFTTLLNTERNIIISDTGADTIIPEYSAIFASAGVKALLFCPVRAGGSLLGMLRVEQTETTRFWTSEEQSFGASIADFTIIARESSRVYESERRMSTLLSNLPGTAFRCRCNPTDLVMEYLSDGCIKMTGYTPDELLGKSAATFDSIIHPEDLKKVYADLHKMLTTKEPIDTNFRILHKEGGIRWIWQRGQVVGFSGEGNEYALVEGFPYPDGELVWFSLPSQR